MDFENICSRQPQQIALCSTIDGTSYVVFVRNIIYVEREKDPNNVYVHYQDAFDGVERCVCVRGTLKRFNEILPNHFMKINRSVIVNIRYVSYYNDDEVAVWTPKSKCMVFAHKYDVSQFIVEF